MLSASPGNKRGKNRISLSKETYAEPTQSVRLVYQVPKK